MIVVGIPVAGLISRHQPPRLVVVFDPSLLYTNSDQGPCAVAPANVLRNVADPEGSATAIVPGSCGAGAGGAGVKVLANHAVGS